MLDHLFGGVLLLRRVLAGPGEILPCEQRLPARHRGPGFPALAHFARFPGALARPIAAVSPVVVLALAGVAAHPRRSRPHQSQDGMTEIHLAARAARVDVAADPQGCRYGATDLRSQRGEDARRFA